MRGPVVYPVGEEFRLALRVSFHLPRPMTRARRALLLLSVVGLLVHPGRAQSDEAHAAAKRAAQTAAQSWLENIDDDDFDESWEEASGLLQKQIEREKWIEEGRRLRKRVEGLSGRTRTMVQYRDSIQHAPSDGPFVILKYRSTFEDGCFEELLLTVREDDTWKVAGYQVAPLDNADAGTSPPEDDSSS